MTSSASLAIGAVLICAAATACAQAPLLQLVTLEEAAAWADDSGHPFFAPKSAAGAPVIELVHPDLGGGRLSSPLAIELRFKPAADSRIDPASFRVFYGAFKIDITQRLVQAAAVGPAGLRVEQAAVPPGSHRLLVQVADDRARLATRELRFTIE